MTLQPAQDLLGGDLGCLLGFGELENGAAQQKAIVYRVFPAIWLPQTAIVTEWWRATQ